MIPRRAAVALAVAAVLGVTAAARAEDPAPDAAAVEEAIAVEGIRALRGAARDLKRISRKTGEAHARWLRGVVPQVDSIGSRWSGSFQFYQRDFPREALLADPERLAAAASYLGEVNRNLREETATLRARLLEKNETFDGDGVAQVRAVLEGLEPWAAPETL